MKKSIVDILFYLLLVATQAAAIVFYGIFHHHVSIRNLLLAPVVVAEFTRYPLFQDIHIMVFVGIGFLFAFLKRFKLTGIVNVFWIAAFSIQYYFLWRALFFGAWEFYDDFYITPFDLIRAEFCAMAMVIAIGALIGKTNNFQLLVMAIIGVFLYTITEQVIFNSIDTSDTGGTIMVFAFGAFYGIGVSWPLNYRQSRDNLNFVTNVTSNTFALIGTLFLWCFFLSFNSALAANPILAHMAVINTYFCLIGSLMGTFLYTTLTHRGKFHMEHMLNATITGGVVMGAGGIFLESSFVAYIIGLISGIISAFSYTYISRLLKKMRLIDVAGVLHTFGVPGVLGGAVYSAIFRARWADRGGVQVGGLFIAIGIAFIGGLIIGLFLRCFGYYKVEDEYYNDMETVYFDDVADYHANPQRFHDNQRRLVFGPRVNDQALVYTPQPVSTRPPPIMHNENPIVYKTGNMALHDNEQVPDI